MTLSTSMVTPLIPEFPQTRGRETLCVFHTSHGEWGQTWIADTPVLPDNAWKLLTAPLQGHQPYRAGEEWTASNHRSQQWGIDLINQIPVITS